MNEQMKECFLDSLRDKRLSISWYCCTEQGVIGNFCHKMRPIRSSEALIQQVGFGGVGVELYVTAHKSFE